MATEVADWPSRRVLGSGRCVDRMRSQPAQPAQTPNTGRRKIAIYCGIDWPEKTHDVALVDDSGQLLAKRHITDDAAS